MASPISLFSRLRGKVRGVEGLSGGEEIWGRRVKRDDRARMPEA